MKKTLPLLAVCGLLTMAACQSNDKTTAAAAAADPNAEAAVRQRVQQFDAAYARKDEAGLMALVDADADVMFGTDSAEMNVGKAAVAQQMKDDFAAVDSVRFGALTNYHSLTSPTLATAFFDSPVAAYAGGHRYPSLMRFATVWRKRDDGQWYLTQTLVSRPTKGQSSHEMAAAAQQKRSAATK